jgi:hypothetical protein
MGSYEGTGRSLSLKLVQQLREKDRHAHAQPQADGSSARVLREIALETPIRHARSLQRVFAVAEWCGTGGRAGPHDSSRAPPLYAPSRCTPSLPSAAGGITRALPPAHAPHAPMPRTGLRPRRGPADAQNRLRAENSTDRCRYSAGDKTEEWLHRLLCLDATNAVAPVRASDTRQPAVAHAICAAATAAAQPERVGSARIMHVGWPRPPGLYSSTVQVTTCPHPEQCEL